MCLYTLIHIRTGVNTNVRVVVPRRDKVSALLLCASVTAGELPGDCRVISTPTAISFLTAYKWNHTR